MKRAYENKLLSWSGLSEKASWGPLTGNGKHGAALFGSEKLWKLSLDHSDVQDLRMSRKPWINAPFQEIRKAIVEKDSKRIEKFTHAFYGEDGDDTPTNLNLGCLMIHIDIDGEMTQVRESMDFASAEIIRRIMWGSSGLEMKATSISDSIMTVIELTAINGSRNIRLELQRTQFEETLEKKVNYPSSQPIKGAALGFSQMLHDGMAYAIQVFRSDGSDLNKAEISLDGGESIRLVIATAQGASVTDSVDAISCSEKDCDVLLQQNRIWWLNFWAASEVELSDKELESIWYHGVYLQACASRSGSLPITLQGVFTPDGAPGTWGGGIFSNLNTQLSYWSCCGANHPELVRPLADFLLDSRVCETMEKETREFFDLPGIAVPVSTNATGQRLQCWMPVQIWPTTGSWLCLNIWEMIRSTNDVETLKKAYPFFKKNEIFMTAYGAMAGKDYPVFAPSHSPEIFDLDPDKLWMENPTMDLWAYRKILNICIESARWLEVDFDDQKAWIEKLDLIPNYPLVQKQKWTDGSGKHDHSDPHTSFLIEAEGINTELSHRHLSQCAPIYPGDDINIDSEDPNFVADSVFQNIRRGTGLWIGYSFVWQSCLASRCELADMAMHHLKTYWRHFTSNGGLHANGETTRLGITDFNREYYDTMPLSIEASLAAPAAVNEMLFQSWRGIIRLFPALPDEIQGAFYQLRTKQGDLVSANKADGFFEACIVPASRTKLLRVSVGNSNLIECNCPYRTNKSGRTSTIDIAIEGRKDIRIQGSIKALSERGKACDPVS
ncbi:glycosyl hydrolase family 95 catalytic domain-containing protein [Rubellicoccus peritrichatus]|uniref:Glycosyl hydrolase family 95 catalytic domain-containing protein n=1 Tax=Rubellicoccus peritrichatus TaxID=3080537 RepID=A0AAQ3L8H9_9BACT|nr:hypothetical protein [Puniceicoccus sp. CR14]WOO39622.1 hypothetical protein RZN69_13440 [Puniceicoccus sp. CR14]